MLKVIIVLNDLFVTLRVQALGTEIETIIKTEDSSSLW
jgi:hypothetical protein